MVGLVRIGGGSLTVLGQPVPNGLPKVLPRIGAIVEGPAFFPRFTVRRNMEILTKMSGVGRKGIDAALERVGIADRANSSAKDLSMGMRQRLAIACTLIKDPDLLVFDEPANGVDPEGIVQVRELIRSLGAEGRTVLVSSQILSEIEQTADWVAILSRGRTLASGPVGSFLGGEDRPGVVVRVADAARAVSVLEAAEMGAVRTDAGGDELRVSCLPAEAERVTRTLADNGMYVREIRPVGSDLESAYLRLTSDADEEPP
jgi:ABC-2 type transport system ATP-binding protein